MSKKIVVKLDLHDNKDKQKALKAVSVLVGIDAVSLDMASRKMTVMGTVDPVDVVSKLRKSSWAANIESVGPAKEPEKKEEAKKDGDVAAKKDGDGAAKKKDGDGGKKDGDGGKKEAGDGKKKEEGGGKKGEGGGGGEQKKPAAVAPLHHLPPPYMLNAEYMNHHYRPQPPPQYMLNAEYMSHHYRPQPAYPPYVSPQYHYVSMEENPNSCAIC